MAQWIDFAELKIRISIEELGLEVAKVPHYGYAHTTLPKETCHRYDAEVATLQAVLIHRRTLPQTPTGPKPPGGKDDDSEGDDKPTSRSRKAVCKCPFIIRVSKSTLEQTVIVCGTCVQPFQLA